MSSLTPTSLTPSNSTSLDRATIAHDEAHLQGRPLQAEWLTAANLRLLIKRVIDWVGASVGLILLTPVMLLIALLVRLDSPGPVLFRQLRRGHRGRLFRVLQFRTMMEGAEQYLPDDVLRYSRGSRVVGVTAGQYATVKDTDAKQNLLTVERQDGQQVSYDPRRLQGVSVYREAERNFAEGDRIQFTAPSKELHVASRELGTIVRIDERGEIAVRTDSGRVVEFQLKNHPHLDYGYAVTSHSSQGQTADRVLIHADTEESPHLVNSRMAYVAVSRGRYDAQIYTNDKSELAQHLSRDVSHSTAIHTGQDHAGTTHSQGHVQGEALGV